MSEHLPNVEIERIDVENAMEHLHDGIGFAVGFKLNNVGVKWHDAMVTRIEAFTKSGMHSYIPYVRVWAGNEPVAEFCQHNIVGIYFKRADISS